MGKTFNAKTDISKVKRFRNNNLMDRCSDREILYDLDNERKRRQKVERLIKRRIRDCAGMNC